MASKPSKWCKQTLNRLLRRKRAGSQCSTSTSTSKREEFREAFNRFDSDGDGKLSSSELHAFLTWAGSDDDVSNDVERVVRAHDSDGDGLLDYGDFVKLMEAGRVEGEEEEDLRRAFEMFEVEKGSGLITPRGLKHVLGRLGEERSHEECVEMIRAFDLDGNGVLDYQEFMRMMS